MNKIITKRKPKMGRKLIAPCGMNCALCSAYLRDKNRCPGCHGDKKDLRPSCAQCRIKNCPQKKGKAATFCYECELFPCARLKHLDKRYRTRYGMSMITNLGNIEKLGINKFVKNQGREWACPKCGGIICVHTGNCINCGWATRRAKRIGLVK